MTKLVFRLVLPLGADDASTVDASPASDGCIEIELPNFEHLYLLFASTFSSSDNFIY